MNLVEHTTPKPPGQLPGEIDAVKRPSQTSSSTLSGTRAPREELIMFTVSKYSAGSLLCIRNTHQLFANRGFEGAPKLNSYSPTYRVPDGQHLTSLYQAFYGEDEHGYYLPLNEYEQAMIEEAIFSPHTNTMVAWGSCPLQAWKSGRVLNT